MDSQQAEAAARKILSFGDQEHVTTLIDDEASEVFDQVVLLHFFVTS